MFVQFPLRTSYEDVDHILDEVVSDRKYAIDKRFPSSLLFESRILATEDGRGM